MRGGHQAPAAPLDGDGRPEAAAAAGYVVAQFARKSAGSNDSTLDARRCANLPFPKVSIFVTIVFMSSGVASVAAARSTASLNADMLFASLARSAPPTSARATIARESRSSRPSAVTFTVPFARSPT